MNSLKVHEELKKHLESEAGKIGKNISWFKFAKKTKQGYIFLANKEVQLRKLEGITQKIVKKYNYTAGELADMFSQLVNS